MTSSRQFLSFLGALWAGVVFGSPSALSAPGTISLSWGTCSPVVANIESPASGPLSLVVSEIGNDETHTAYEVRFLIHGTDDLVPDAWRFDAAGCQYAGLLQVSPYALGAVSKSCPPFQGIQSSYQTKSYDFITPTTIPKAYLPPTWMVCTFGNTYPGGNTTLATQRYHLATFQFDHSFSTTGPSTPGVTCGGFEKSMVFSSYWHQSRLAWGVLALYLGSDGLVHEFSPGTDLTVTVNGSVPARTTSWGQVKDTYRRSGRP